MPPKITVKKTENELIADKYKKFSNHEHVLARPGMYIGSIEEDIYNTWVYDHENKKMIKKTIKYTPGLYKIFDEILVNTIDHITRLKSINHINPVKNIHIKIDKVTGTFEISNDGQGIEIVKHPEYDIYIPELIFGNMLTSTNYNDNEEKIIGGQNGLGSKCISVDTKIPLFNGIIKIAKNINIGDILIGDDGNQRVVLNTTFGTGKMYEITQKMGEKYQVNDEHILTLYLPDHKVIFWSTNGWKILWWNRTNNTINTKIISINCDMNNENIQDAFDKIHEFAKTIDNNNIIDISIKNYLDLTKTIQSKLVGLRGNCVNWDYKNVELDPYVLGLWLGYNVQTGYNDICDTYDTYPGISSIDNFHKKDCVSLIKKHNLVNNKHVPKEYIINSREVRLNVLAGFIDTNGNVSRNGTCIQISQGLMHKILIYDLLYIARSLGFYCTLIKFKAKYTLKNEKIEKDAFKLNISGNIDDIPTKLYIKKCVTTKSIDIYKSTGQLEIKEIENSDYIGFEIDKNQRFLINDFTVTHNCTNIFSNKFEVETVDYTSKMHYHQVFENNMKLVHPPTIEKYKKKPDITTVIRFTPDYIRLNMKNGLTDDMYDVIIKRVYDACAVTDNDINIYLNDEKLNFKNFEKYIDLFLGPKNDHDRVYEKINERWEIIASYNDFNGFEQLSFVNGICTIRGGKHVDYICNQIIKKLTDLIVKKNKNITIKSQSIKDNLILFVKATIVNPSFDSQSKETLTTPVTKFGGEKAEISDKFITALYKSGIVEKVLEISQLNDAKILQKTDGKKKNIIRGLPKLEDANWAGTTKSSECILILTEGDSTTGDTPLLLKHNNMVTIKTIETISNNDKWIENNGKEYNKTDCEVWTEKGWTKINHVFRHKVNKRIFRILTHTGVVDVTEDHSLIKKNGIEISPKDCVINDELLHSFPQFTEHKILFPENWSSLKIKELWKIASKIGIQYYQQIHKKDLIKQLEDFENLQNNNSIEFINNDKLTIDEAYLMGLFLADGSCGIIKPYWKINNCNINFLEKCLLILKNLYPNYLFEIREDISSKNNNYKSLYALVIRKANVALEFVKKYRELFYDEYKKKKVPELIFNARIKIKQSFFDGFYDGDGQKYNEAHVKPSNELRFDFDGKIGSHGMYFISKSLGYNVSINIRADKPKVYRLNLTKEHQQDNPCRIKKIWDMGITEQYVYDLETENHHFQAGVGQMIVHNSAASMAISGLSEIGRDKYGVFPLKGKILNVRDANTTKIADNDEIINLKKIIGLENGKVYKSVNELRYGKIMIMTDQDHDGSHIKGLLFNLFHTLWPSLLKSNNFTTALMTPIVKVIKNKETIQFYNLADYTKWTENVNNNGWNIKYYKGLGTSTADEALQYFRDMKLINYKYTETESDNKLALAFDKTKADDRKVWIGNFDKNNVLDYNESDVTYEDFVNKELIHFSNYDVERSIPNMMDGLKISQRKILFCAFKKNLTEKEIKVAQFAAYVSENSAYHHGEASLQSTIVGMAQNFIGSNNINLLKPNGQFGTRQNGGKDAGQPRYIFTLLSQLATKLFIKDDSNILTYLNDDGDKIEPEYYIPIIPTILVNGSLGIGTGFSTNIPCYNPKEIITVLKRLLDEEDVSDIEMIPWYNGFTGSIEKINGKYFSRGKFTKINSTKIEITELPIGTWTYDFKCMLEDMMDKNQDIKSYENNSGTINIKFTITFANSDVVDDYLRVESNSLTKFENDFKLSTSKPLGITNMYAFNSKCTIQKYNSPIAIIQDFYKVRLEYYKKRKDYLTSKLKYDLDLLLNKIRFIQAVVNEEIILHKMRKIELDSRLTTDEYIRHEGTYDYITRIPVYNLTIDKVEDLEKDVIKATEKYDDIMAKDIRNTWKDELDLLIILLETYLKASPIAAKKIIKKSIVKKSIIKKID